MSRLRVVVIVEGDGEVAAVPILLRRLWAELGGQYIEVLGPPIRRKRAEFERQQPRERAVSLAAIKLKHAAPSTDPGLVLIMFDRDPSNQPPCFLGPQALQWAETSFSHLDITCVVANIEYETWFVAAAESLAKYIRLKPTETIPDTPESQRCGRGGLNRGFEVPSIRKHRISPQ